MKQINLTLNQVALVDDEDYEYLNQFKWHAVKGRNTYYAKRHNFFIDKKSKKISMHREILGLSNHRILCDHIDKNGLNNCRNNLRIATYAQNCSNVFSRKNSTSKFLGVHLQTSIIKGKTYSYWIASIRKDYKLFHLGCFNNEVEAAKKYNNKAAELFGDFANLNIIPVEKTA